MSDFLLELASEEIPARMQAAAAEQLRTRLVDGLKAAGLPHGDVIADVTPRRLWLIARDVADASAAASEERKGPSASAPEAAIAGFLRSTGLTRDQLEERQTPKGVVLFAHIRTEGRPAAAILAELVPAIVRDFAWPKSMRWGAASAVAGSPRWVRPLTGIVALLDGEVVPCAVHGVTSGRVTRGHRIHAPEPIEIAGADSYAAQLRDGKVIVASAERRAVIEAGAAAVAAARGLVVRADAGLVAENAGLTEWPVPMLGAFDAAFLAVPPEVIQLTMRTNQKYFACEDAGGVLAPAFVCVANLEATDGGTAIVAGNERVLSARLADAKFFWDQDLKAELESFLPRLGDIVFHEKLGTVADKVARVAKLARWLVESGAITSPLAGEVGLGAAEPGEGGAGDDPSPRSPSASRPLPQGEREELADLAEQAARLCKADLVSATVGEFPEVQGIAGAYLARAQGLDARVADAIRDHYKPVGQGDDVPTAPVSVAVALADKLDTLVEFFEVGEFPTGSRDPFALRRAALGVIAIVVKNELRLPLWDVVLERFGAVHADLVTLSKVEVGSAPADEVSPAVALVATKAVRNGRLLSFFADRLKVQQRDAGVRHDLIDAVLANGIDDLVLALARVRALQLVLATEDGANLLAGVKRAANILRIEEGKEEAFAPQSDAALFAEPAETALATALDTAVPAIADAVAREDFTAAMAALAGLRPAVDAFFDSVIVNAPDPAIRANRLGLLARLRAAANSVADFSKVEG
ncbi:glycyl-tRNA synthetase beta chain [Polymorphobacter fuscus]|uniref:glycine--tRNA ligase subunit beta n=1 Tax=Sandarakinorhabdus fusca TaxID=1439888 RepID=UPI0014313AAB|nr:glycine--tRNA ligase subunit beta [Polymorphobacter fuscus]NJC08370.1 glycyl-tRNA synthetase beta chain [Polymorphobacter fuscus]